MKRFSRRLLYRHSNQSALDTRKVQTILHASAVRTCNHMKYTIAMICRVRFDVNALINNICLYIC